MTFSKRFIGHFKTVLRHKRWVFYYCCKAGIPIRGLFHDMSKFSPTEFVESVKYFHGKRSPIDVCKEANGYSEAWMHHKGLNRHHYEYWQDNFDNGGTPVKMPYEYAIEMVCDYLGAGRAYMGDSFTFEAELQWWENKKKSPLAMHPHTMQFVDSLLRMMAKRSSCACLKPETSKALYDYLA